MQKITFILILALAFMSACKTEPPMDTNPLLVAYNTPFEIAPFDKIKPAHFMPAFEAGIEQQQQNIKAIAENPEAPTFENTIEALEYSNPLLTKVSSVFYNLTGANTNDSLKAIAQQVAPLLSKLSDDIYLNESLFLRIKTLYDNKEKLNLNKEQAMLLEKKHKAFVRGGANLPA